MGKENFPIDIDQQSLEVPESDGVRQSTLMLEGVLQDYVFEDAKTVVEALHRGHKVSNNGPCLGWRASESVYKWMSYEEVIERAKLISYGLVHVGMKKGQEAFVGIYAQNSVEWVLMEHACYNQSAVLVPLYDTLGPKACTIILKQVEAEFLVCDTEKKVKYILDIKEEIPKLSHIIVVEEVSKETLKLAENKGVKLHLLKEIEEIGKQKPDTVTLPSPSDLATICYTSGTTGDPKGVMLTHANMVAAVSGIIKHVGVDVIGPGDTLMSYLPMAHMLDRTCQIILYMTGGAVGFFRGNIKLLAEDIIALKPTMLHSVPRVLNKVYDKVQEEVKRSYFKKFFLDVALWAKKGEIERGTIRNNSLWDHFILKSVRNAFGGRVRILMTGGAPVRNEVLSFFKQSMGCHVIQAYGQTECTCGCTCTVMEDHKVGNAGPPMPCSFVKLADVPDMDYYAEKGEGEILVKGPNVMKGYFKDPVRTAEVLDKDGWLHTGDIAKWTEYGALCIIDRKKNLLKLSQGEYISPEKLEAIYQACKLVEQIYVHGDSFESCLVAIIAAAKESLMFWCSEQGIQGNWNEICENKDVKEHILKELNNVGLNASLKGFEQVRAVHLHPDGFSLQNGLLTATMKFRRGECQKQFKDVIRKMYDDLR